jgi:hypothetical protein
MSRARRRRGRRWPRVRRELEAASAVGIRLSDRQRAGLRDLVDACGVVGASAEFYDELRNIARRHWTAMAMLEAERLLDVLDAEIVDQKRLAASY